MHSAENTSEVRCLTDAELDNVAGGNPVAVGVILFVGGVLYGCLSGPYDFEATPPSWYKTMI